MFGFSVLYGFIGLLLNEPSFMKLFKCCKRRATLGSSRESVLDYSENETEIAESGVDYINQIKNIANEDPNYVLIAKGISKTYPSKKDRKA